MTRSIRQPSLAELTDRMIAAKLSAPVAEAGEHEVEPYEVMNGFRTDPRTAYTEATAAAKLLGVSGQPTTLPPEWASFVQTAAGSPAVPMAAGQFPQRVRDAAELMDADDLTAFAPAATTPVSGFQQLRAWVKKLLAMRCLGSVGALLEFWELALMLGELQGLLVGFWGSSAIEKYHQRTNA